MHPLPCASQLDWLLGDRLDAVCTAEFTVWFSFDRGGVLQSDLAVTVVGADDASWTYDPQTRSGDWSFHHIVGGSVVSVQSVDEMTLKLEFASGSQLIIQSNDGPYETGRIAFPDGTVAYF
jgi:hypothetical protein